MSETLTATAERLREVRLKMLHLHQMLLEIERRNYERVHGRVNSGELLQLVINHPQFAWLRTVSALVAQIDETLYTDEPAMATDILNLMTSARDLFTASENQEFRQKYQTVLQQEPDVVMAHSALMKLLRSNS